MNHNVTSNIPSCEHEFDQLAAALRNGLIDSDGLSRLESIAIANPQLLSRLVDMLNIEARLEQIFKGKSNISKAVEGPPEALCLDGTGQLRDADSLELVLNSGRGNSKPTDSSDQREAKPKRRLIVSLADRLPNAIDPRHHPARFLTLVASLTIATWVAFAAVFLPHGQSIAQAPAPRGTSEPLRRVATLVGIADAEWHEHGTRVYQGANFLSGQTIELTAGQAELEFLDKTRVVLAAGTRLRLDDRARCSLEAGTITARVRDPASGFCVLTPRLAIVDLGTEFGVSVHADLTTRIHVFQGKIEVGPAPGVESVRDMPSRQLAEGESLTLGPNDMLLALATIDEEDFPRRLQATQPRELPDRLLPVTEKLVLWLAADVRVETDAEGRVLAWGDILAGDNHAADNAWQRDPVRRPRWIENAIGDQPAVRFGPHRTQMLTSAFKTTGAQTIVAVVAPDAAQGALSGQVYNGNGPPQLVLECRTGGLAGRKFLGSAGNSGQIDASTPGSMRTIVSYRYDPDNTRADLRMNGQLVGSAEAAAAPPNISVKVIGNYPGGISPYCGDLAELILYNSALTDDAIGAVEQYLTDKYSEAVD